MPKPPKKWEATGEAILTVEDFDMAWKASCVVAVPRLQQGRPISARFIANMSFAQVCRLIHTGQILLCKTTKEYKEWLREEAST